MSRLCVLIGVLALSNGGVLANNDSVSYPGSTRKAEGRTARSLPCLHRSSSQPGECIPLPLCPSAVVDRLNSRHPQICGFPSGASFVPDVCCPVSEIDSGGSRLQPTRPSVMSCGDFNRSIADALDRDSGLVPGSKARRACLENQRKICSTQKWDDHRPGVFELAGAYFDPAEPMEFPHMALLGYGERDDIEYSCGGSLISDKFVLTAAHCASSQRYKTAAM